MLLQLLVLEAFVVVPTRLDLLGGFAFEEDGCLYIDASRDDTVSPPVYFDPDRHVKNWYICLTRYSYLYTTLSWKVGLTGTPQNPSCQKVDVIRVYN